jgi:hypothetical protein
MEHFVIKTASFIIFNMEYTVLSQARIHLTKTLTTLFHEKFVATSQVPIRK